MSLERKFFGTNGIRGIPGVDLTLEFIVEMSQAIGTYFGKGPILVGYDGRLSSPLISKAVSAGVMASGLDVSEAGLTPTPGLQYSVKKLGYNGGVMITASHNPPQYNGIKVVGPDGVEIPRQDEVEIERIYIDRVYKRADWRDIGSYRSESAVIQTYIEGTLSQVDEDVIKKRDLKVVLDLGNSVATLAIPYALSSLGCKVLTINGHIDGEFSGRGPEPTPSTLSGLSNNVKSSGADVGIAYDGDGDRAIFCDEKGIIHWGDMTGTLLVNYLLKKSPGALVVTTVSTSQMVDLVAKKRSSKVLRTRVGSVEVSRAMIDNDALLGLEENGGFFYAPHIQVRDGLMTSLLILEALSHDGRPFSEILLELPKFHQRKAKFQCPNEIKMEVMREIERRSKGKVEKIDGVKIWADESTWILLRPSGTEPLIRVFGESKDAKILDELIERYSSIVVEIIEKIKEG
ncbi:MAG: phosphoglucosamine mutase [Candidatus Methylarchaceae archaeon HK02M1]|nr:phosphoglucosamine mutase [Candidatus Methylarchaceae archaeon HK01M]MCP8312340.1 phosphoglucosamine mutase [Candidatus Methylarchaceae archaeon HK02M1]